MITSSKSASALAATAASLILAGAVSVPQASAEAAKGHCMGANACKGHGACKSASNACKGQNACKGKGFVEMTKAECDAVKGATFKAAKS